MLPERWIYKIPTRKNWCIGRQRYQYAFAGMHPSVRYLPHRHLIQLRLPELVGVQPLPSQTQIMSWYLWLIPPIQQGIAGNRGSELTTQDKHCDQLKR